MKRMLWIFPILGVFAFGQQWQRMEQTLTGSTSAFIDGPGHSWADVDGDGDFDLFLNGSQELWMNRVNETQSFVSAQDMLPAGLNGSGWAACFGDFDNDGDPDVHCGNSNVDFLLENRWPNPFVDVAPQYALTDSDWNQSINWVDYNNDGLLDIYITHERPSTDGPHEFYENDFPNAFIPRFPTGGGPDTFGLADLNSHAYGLTWADFDLDGDLDAVTSACGSSSTIPNEDPHNKIYRNRHPIMGFEDLSLAIGLVTPQEVLNGSSSYWAMLFDYDGDAFPDLSIGATGGAHRLWRNTGVQVGDFGIDLIDPLVHDMQGGGAFVDGACAGDFDNDGDLDVYTTPDGLHINDGNGSFIRRSDLVPGGGSDASFVDYDRDGHLDVFNFQDLWRNPGGYGNHWIAIELEGDPTRGVTRSAHHIKIRVTANGVAQHREHRFMVGSYSQHMLPTHFGLGDAEIVDEIQITWNNDASALFQNVPVDRYITLRQGADCSGSLQATQNTHYFCAGDTINLSATNSNGEPASWRVVRGPSDFPGQFGDPDSLNTTFTPAAPGYYQLSLGYQGCPDAVVVDLYDTDHDGDGAYGPGDLNATLPFWRDVADIEAIDRNGNGIAEILDMMATCPTVERLEAGGSNQGDQTGS